MFCADVKNHSVRGGARWGLCLHPIFEATRGGAFASMIRKLFDGLLAMIEMLFGGLAKI